jgi:hypothetical protein
MFAGANVPATVRSSPACAANCAVIVSAHDAPGRTGQNDGRGIFAGNREFWPVSSERDGIRFGLANRRLQPLGHLTARRMLSIYDISIYANDVVPMIVPEIVPAQRQESVPSMAASSRERQKGRQRFFSQPCIPANSAAASVCSPELPTRFAGADLDPRGDEGRSVRRSTVTVCNGLLNRRLFLSPY